MDAPLDQYRASREELIALVLRHREQLAELEREQARLRAEAAAQQAALAALQARMGALLAALEPPDGEGGAPRPTTMPGLKPAAHGSAAPGRPIRRGISTQGQTRLTFPARYLPL